MGFYGRFRYTLTFMQAMAGNFPEKIIVNDALPSWFHCGRCNALFEAPIGKLENRVCSKCGGIPCLGDEVSAESANPSLFAHARTAEPGKQTFRKRKKSHLFLKLGVASIAIIGLMVFAGNSFKQRHAPAVATTPVSDAKLRALESDSALITDAMPQASATLAGFLAATTPEQRNQFVLAPIKTAPKMAAFYSNNPLVKIDPATMKITQRAVLNLPHTEALETTWTSTDGYKIDAVFVKEADEWRLDWNHFVRYSSYPWPLFLSGSGPEVGEFRLLARQRLADERKAADSISLVLYPPRFGSPIETGQQSPEFLVLKNSQEGRQLDAGFVTEKAGKRAFGVKLPDENPGGLIRVHLKVRRSEGDAGRKFEIEQVIACHWYSTTESGLVLPDQPAAK